MAITDINLTGYVFQDDGDALEGATVELLETGTTTVEATYSGGTTSAGLWTFTETSLDTTYDLKVTSGSSIRKRMWADEITLKTVDVSQAKIRGTEGAAAPLYFFADQADDAGDAWRIQASASDTLAIGSDKASAGTIIDYLTVTNGANAAASTVTVGGILAVTTTLDVNGTADYDVTDYDIASSGDIDLVSTNDAVAAIYLRANGGTSETIKLHADQGTSVTEGAESVTILSDAGGVGIRSTANLANALNLTVDGGTTSSMTLFNDTGTTATEGSASIQLLSDVGGINIKSGLNGANAILLTADGGTSETILIHADQGTAAASIELLSDAGGIELDAGADIILDAGGADIFLKDDGTLFGTLTNSSGELVIKSSSSGTTAMTFSGADVTFSGTVTIGSAAISEAELEILDGATVTTTELNYNDTGAAVGTVVASRTVTVDSSKDVASFRNITLTGELDAGSLDVSGDADIDGTLETDALTVGGTNVLTGSLITTLGTISAGVWQGTDVGVAYGGTGVSTLTANGVLIGNGTSAIGAVDMSTKGHLLIGDGSGNPQMLGVGTNTHVMTADSGETTGVKWAAPAAAAAGSLTGSTLASGVTASSLTSLGTIATGVWQGTDVGVAYGGTGVSTLTSNAVLTGNGASAITAEGNLTFDGSNLDLNNQGSIINIGASGNDWTQNSLTLAGGTSTQTLNVGDATNPDDARIRLFTKAGAAGENSIILIEGSGNGDDNNNAYKLRYNTSTDRIEFSTQDSDGSSTAADIYRIPDGQTTIDANTTWDDNVFDDHDDAMVLSPYREGILNLRARNDELIRIGVLRRYEDGWVGYSDQRMAALLAGGIYQNRHRMDAQHDAMDERLAKIEAAIGV